jgi:hypothetical protein
MSRVSPGEPIPISATNNIYTVLVAAAVVVVLVALIVLCVRFNTLYQAWPWG